MTQEQSVLTKIMTVIAAEEIILQYRVLGCTADAYLTKHKLGIESMNKGVITDLFTMKQKDKKQ